MTERESAEHTGRELAAEQIAALIERDWLVIHPHVD